MFEIKRGRLRLNSKYFYQKAHLRKQRGCDRVNLYVIQPQQQLMPDFYLALPAYRLLTTVRTYVHILRR